MIKRSETVEYNLARAKKLNRFINKFSVEKLSLSHLYIYLIILLFPQLKNFIITQATN